MFVIQIIHKGLILIEKIFITIDHSKNITKFVKIETEIKNNNKNNHLIQKIYRKKCSFEKFKDYIDEYQFDCQIQPYFETLSKYPTKDNFIVSRKIQAFFETYQIIYNKDTYQCRFFDCSGDMEAQSGSGSSPEDDTITKQPEEVVNFYNKDLSKLLDYQNKVLELKDTDKDIDTIVFKDYDYRIFTPFWQKNFIHSLRLVMKKISKDETIKLERLYITIDYSQNKTKYLKIENEVKGENEKKHLIQKIYKEKCSLEKFKSDIKKYQSDFQILTGKDMLSNPPSIDIYILSENNKGSIKRTAYLYDKENKECKIEVLEGENGNFMTNSSSEKKTFREMYGKYEIETSGPIWSTFKGLKREDEDEDEDEIEQDGEEM